MIKGKSPKQEQWFSDNLEYCETIIRMYTDGMNPEEIARTFGKKYGTVYHNLRSLGVEMRTVKEAHENSEWKPPKKYNIPKETLRKLYFDDLKSMNEIADFYKCSVDTVMKRMIEYGFQRRDKSKNGKLVFEKQPWRREYMRKLANEGRTGVFFSGNQYRNTKEERCFEKLLNDLDISYKREYNIFEGGHAYDFYLPKYNLLVEIDGAYWHDQEDQIVKDLKHNEEATENGYDILRIRIVRINKDTGEYYKEMLMEKIGEH